MVKETNIHTLCTHILVLYINPGVNTEWKCTVAVVNTHSKILCNTYIHFH